MLRHHTEATDLDRQLAEEVLGHYVGGREGLVDANRGNLTNMLSDAFFWYGVEDFIRKHVKQETGAVYQYMNTHKVGSDMRSPGILSRAAST